jgi:hypothetical protein
MSDGIGDKSFDCRLKKRTIRIQPFLVEMDIITEVIFRKSVILVFDNGQIAEFSMKLFQLLG